MMLTTLTDLVRTVYPGFPDDPLGQRICNEITDSFNDSASDASQLAQAHIVVERHIDRLNIVAEAIARRFRQNIAAS